MRPSPAFLLALLLTTPAFAQTSAPAATPVAGSPRAAVLDFTKAYIAGDQATVAGLLVADDADSKRMAKSMADTATAISTLSKAMTDKFGPEATHAALGDPQVAMKMATDQLAAAAEAVDGDTATVRVNNSPQGTMHLKKVDGKWKLDPSQMLKGLDPKMLDNTLAALDKGNATLTRFAAEVTSGKYKSAPEAKDALDVETTRAAMQPTTMPATGPAPTAPLTGGATPALPRP